MLREETAVMTPCARGDKRRTENSRSNPISLPSQRSHRATALQGTAAAFNGTPSQINTRHRDERLWDGDLKKTGGWWGVKRPTGPGETMATQQLLVEVK